MRFTDAHILFHSLSLFLSFSLSHSLTHSLYRSIFVFPLPVSSFFSSSSSSSSSSVAPAVFSFFRFSFKLTDRSHSFPFASWIERIAFRSLALYFYSGINGSDIVDDELFVFHYKRSFICRVMEGLCPLHIIYVIFRANLINFITKGIFNECIKRQLRTTGRLRAENQIYFVVVARKK